jgi:uncharacterized protein (DUF4415 family)
MNENDRDVDMQDEYDFSHARRGPILPPVTGKTRISIRIDNDLLEWFREQVRHGGNYQTLMNHALRAYMSRTSSEVACTAPVQDVWTFERESQSPPPHPTVRELYTSLPLIQGLRELVRQIVREEFERAK